MSRNAFILIVGFFLYVSSPPRGIYANPVTAIAKNPATSVLDVIINDAEICASGKPFSESSYVTDCKKFEYPSDKVILKSSNSEQFMCLGLYDRIYRLCYLDTLKKAKQTVLPNSGAEFDQQVKKLLPNNGEAIVQFCETWKNAYLPKYEKTKQFVTQLEKAIRKPALCVKHCTADDASIVPLCIVLATMDNMSELTANGVDNVVETSSKKVTPEEATQPQTQEQQVVVAQNSKEEANIAAPDSQQPVEINAKVEIKVADAQPPKSAETQKTIESADKPTYPLPEKLPEASKTDSNSQKSQQQTVQVLSPTEAKKVDAEAEQPSAKAETKENVKVAVTNAGDDAKKDKDKTPEKQIEEKTDKNVNSDTVNVAEAPAALPPSADAAASLQNEGISGEDISEVGGGGNEDSKLGVISQHTQDELEDRFGDADGMDVAEPPVSLEDDPDQTGNLPPEKKEYIHRLPSPDVDDSHFFGYFTVIGVICIAGYVVYHNKQKILAMVLEGRRSRGGRSRRRPSTANYRKLDCTLEEAVTSQCNSNVTHVIY